MAVPLFGKHMLVYFDNKAMACCTDFDLNFKKDTFEIASYPNSAGYKDYKGGLKSWHVKFNGLVTKTVDAGADVDYDDLMYNIMESDTSVGIRVQPNTADVSSNKYYTGFGILDSLSHSVKVSSPNTFAGTIKGIGPLDLSTNNY